MKIFDFIKRRKYLVAMILLDAIFGIYHILLYRNTSLTSYPWIHQDTWRRLQDSIYYLGSKIEPNFAPPLTSLIFAFFLKLKLNSVFLFGIANFILFFHLIFGITKKLTGNSFIAFLASLLFYFNFYLIQYSLFVGLPDFLCVSLIALSTYLFLCLDSRKNVFVASLAGITAGLAGLAQYLGILIVPVMIVYFLIKHGKNYLFKKKYHQYFAIFVFSALVTFASFFIYKKITYGSFSYSRIEHMGYMRPHVDAIGYYLWQMVVFFTPLVVGLSIYGIRKLILLKNKSLLTFLVLNVSFFLFFIFLYIWKDHRFVIYMTIPVLITAAIGLNEILQKLKGKRFGKLIFLVLVIFILLYSNLQNEGERDVPLWPKWRIGIVPLQNDAGYSQVIAVTKAHDAYIPYYIYMPSYKLRSNSEIYYYRVTTNPYEAFDVAEKLAGVDPSLIQLKISDHYYVRYNELVYFFKYNFPEEVSENSKFKYIISDYSLEDNENYDLFYMNSIYRIYMRN